MEVGATIGHYEVLAKLGQGGMGVVYKARDTRLDRPVALKVLPAELMRDEERRRRFVQEAKAASAVNHPAIAQVYGIEVEGDASFIVMEYIDGSNVRHLVERGELDVLSAVEIGIQVGSALARAHEAGIVHLDIKSDNIMVTRDGHPKVLDFGLAKLVDLGGDGSGAEATMLMTQVGAVMGTASYMSPEQARGLPADQRSDIFSFGIVLYEMATGKLPFEGKSALDTMHAIAFEKTRPMSVLRAGLPFSLQKVVDHCLEKEPSQRYPQMAAVVQDLQAVKRELDSGVTRSAPLLQRFRPRASGLRPKGMLYIAIWGLILLSLMMTVLLREGIGPTVPFWVVGAFVTGHFLTRRTRILRKFAKKVGKETAVVLVSATENNILVLVEDAPAKTFLKINSLFASANEALYSGSNFGIEIRDGATPEERKELLTRPGLLYVDTKGTPRI